MTVLRPDIRGHAHDDLFQLGRRVKEVRREHMRLLPYFKGAEAALDIGCGRRVCLQLLREVGTNPVDVALFPIAVDKCRALSFEGVFHSDTIAFLRERPGSHSGIICSHVIEHLPFSEGKELIHLAFQPLRSDGRLAIETPNLLDIAVNGQIFWLDPTHVRPYPLPLLNALLQAQGFRILRQSNHSSFLTSVPSHDGCCSAYCWAYTLVAQVRSSSANGHKHE